MKKLLLFFSLLLSLLPLPAAAETFEKVTDFSTLKAGDQIIIVANHIKSGSNPYYNGYMLSTFTCSMTKSDNAYGETQEFDLNIDNPPVLITLEESGNPDYPWAMKMGENYIKSTATSTKNGIGTVTSKDNACFILFQTGTTNHQFNNSSASTRKFLRANITNGKTGATQITSGASSLGAKPEIYRLKASGPVDFDYTLPDSKELEENTTFDLGLPEKRPSNITWTSDNPEVAEIENGIINAKKEGTANIKMTWAADDNFNASSEEGQTIVVTVTKPAPVGVPVVTINDKTIEDGCFYEISNGSTATITADNANDITVNGKKVENGAFIIDAATLYEITASNDVSEESLSFNVRLIEPQQGEPTPEVWKQINNVADVTLDGKYIIVANQQNVAISTSASGNYMGNVSVTIDNNSIATLPTDAMVFTLSNAESEGQYRWNCTNASDTSSPCYLYSATNSNNYLKAGNNDNLSVSTIAINETSGVATITFVNCTNSDKIARQIGCNTNNNNVFGAYTNTNQASVYIYKLFGGEPTPIHSTKEYLDLPDFEHDVTAKKITFTCSNTKVLFEERHYDAAASQNYAPKAVADGWNAMADGVFDHSAFTNDIILETRAYREDAAGNRLVESPIHAMRVSASGTVTGIESVAAEAEGKGELYNLQGVRVNRATAAPGLYIERRSGKAVKVIL